MTINKTLVATSKYTLKCPHAMVAEYLTVHNTANDASAKNEIAYMIGNTSQTSFHFAVDDVGVWQGLPLDRNGWHAGDGATGTGNRKTIGIEICHSKSGGDKFTKSESNAAKLVAQLLKERGWGVDRIRKHQDWSGKYCPHRTLDLGWSRFITMVQAEMGGAPMPDTITIEKSVFENLVSKSSKYDGFSNAGYTDVAVVLTKIEELENDVTKAKKDRDTARLERDTALADLATCKATGGGAIDLTKWEMNGLQISTTDNGVVTTKNYKLKG